MSEQFKFGPEHVGKRVRHLNGVIGIIKDINTTPEDKYMAMAIEWGDWNEPFFYSLEGAVDESNEVYFRLDPEATESTPVELVPGIPLYFHDQPVITSSSRPATDLTDYEETPFVPNRAEVWARFMAALIANDYAGWNAEIAAARADKALAEYEKRFLNQ